MGYKKFFIYFLITGVILAGLYSLFIYKKDPLGYYHLKKESRYYSNNGRFQLPAFIKNLDYDTIIIGPSMSQNFNEQTIDQELHVKSFNAALSAASAKEQNYVYQLANKTHHNLKTVFWEINFDSLYGESNRVNNDSGTFPAYLYNTFPLDDIRYLFSSYSGELYFDSREAEKTNASVRTPYNVYKFGSGIPGQTPEQFKDTKVVNNQNPVPDGVSFQDMKENFDSNILPVLKEHPNQEFKLYYTPYPITYHVNNYNRSKQAFLDRLKIKEYVFRQVKDLNNVEIYDFQTEKKVTYTISNYLDGSHYFSTINDWMAQQFAQKAYLQSEEKIQENKAKLLDQVEHFKWKQLKTEK
ncbi:hypothetical protein [Neobacillus bataviensis]|uniref:hypothetical protein n=1 Tax=Neobacillus bataviensis TaxID=220685 RepID=UPI001CBEC3C4|nr:hypothetical protein [Neobacillus bataviensis]